MKAVIPAAGLGTRLLPATKSSPKEMLPVVDKPAIQYVVEECVAAGIRDILIITGRGKRAIEDHFDRTLELEQALEGRGDKGLADEMRRIANLANIHYVRQRETKGLGHAVMCAREFVGDDDFALLLGDDIITSPVPVVGQLRSVISRHGGSVVAVGRVPIDRVSSYGVIAPGRELEPRLHEVKGLVEKPRRAEAPSNLAIVGRYVLSPAVFDHLTRTAPGRNGEIQLTDALHQLAQKESVLAYEPEGRRHDVGTTIEWLKTNVELALERDEIGKELREYLRTLL